MDIFSQTAERPQPAAAEAAQQADAAVHQAGQALRHELTALKSDLDALVSHQATLPDGELSEAYARILARLGTSSGHARVAAQSPERQLSTTYQAACAHIRERPLQSLAVAAVAGLLVGWLRPRK